MKKLLLTMSLMILTAAITTAHPCCESNGPCGCPPPPAMNKPAPPKVDLDKKLKLTDAQKAKAKEIRMRGHKEIRPIFEKLRYKQEQKQALMNNPINKKEQIEMIDNLNEEIMTLKRQLHEARVKNMKEFESILTDKQKKTLEEIKIQSRKDFQKNNRPCPCGCQKK